MKNKSSKMKSYRVLQAAAIVALIAAWVSVPFLRSSAQSDPSIPIVTRTAVLTNPNGGANPFGASAWKLYSDGNREFEAEIENSSLAMGTVLDVVVDGSVAGHATVDDRQKAKLRIRTIDGQAVPVTIDGSTVSINNGATILVNGILNGGGPNPTPTPTGSPTPTPTGTPTGTPTPSPTVTPSPSPSPTGTPNAGDLFAGLSGATINGVLPRGFAQYEVHSSRLELEIRVRQVNLATGTSLRVLVNEVSIGTMSLDRGEGRLRLRSDQGATIPTVVAGSTVTIRNGADAIMNGTFAAFTGPTPTPNPSPSPAPGRVFETPLSGSQIVPPVTTAARGEIKVTLNAAETTATVYGEYNALSSSQTGARIETTVGTITTVFDLGVLGGTEGHFAPATFPVSAGQVQQLRAGTMQAIITSTNNPGGEIAGILTQHTSDSDFDGDGVHDFAVFRSSTGMWYSQNSAGFTSQAFGTAADRVVSGDYDGDGKTDAAVYQDLNGQGVWRISRSSDGGVTTSAFGLATDIPVRGDFDGDGRLDLAVYRPSNGMWYIQKSDNTGVIYMPFGLAGDKPVATDMDGDGKDDIVVFRPSEGNWYWLQSSDGQFRAIHFGQAGDIPVRGDFDGDGRSDVAVFRPSTGVWYVYRSSNSSFYGVGFGLTGDIPVAGDYDNDGRTDVAVFRPSTGMWYILRSSDGSFQAMQFGLNGDIPVIAQ